MCCEKFLSRLDIFKGCPSQNISLMGLLFFSSRASYKNNYFHDQLRNVWHLGVGGMWRDVFSSEFPCICGDISRRMIDLQSSYYDFEFICHHY